MVRFLAALYTHQTCQIQWCNQMSEAFSVSNGVKQGGILSPVLFTVYVDELLQRLKASGMGCYIGNTFLGSFGYADDIILLCPTLHSLRVMLKVAQSFSDDYDINFNIAKSELVVYGKKGLMECSVTFNGVTIVSKAQAKHIGNIIGLDSKAEAIMHGVTDFQRKVNVLMCNFKFTNGDVLHFLFKTYCMPLYGSVLWDLTDTNCERFYTACRKAIRRVWKISPQTHCVLLPLICDDKPIEVQMCNRFLKFYRSLLKSDNSTIKVLLRHAIDDSGSSVANNINILWHRYNINKFNFHLREEKRGALQDTSTPE